MTDKKNILGIKTIISRNPEILFSSIDDESVLLSIEQNNYYGMDSIGSKVWEILKEPTSVENIVLLLMEEFQVSQTTCISDVTTFLNVLEKEKLIKVE